jgi:hypothetical protein
MQRSRLSGIIACGVALVLGALFFYYAIYCVAGSGASDLASLGRQSYQALSLPIIILTVALCGTGFWVGWTILTIKVAPPMPEIVEKKDFAKLKAFFLCLITLGLIALFLYGVSVRSYWALAIPAAAMTLVVLGMVFWVGIAIMTARSTLPADKK